LNHFAILLESFQVLGSEFSQYWDKCKEAEANYARFQQHKGDTISALCCVVNSLQEKSSQFKERLVSEEFKSSLLEVIEEVCKNKVKAIDSKVSQLIAELQDLIQEVTDLEYHQTGSSSSSFIENTIRDFNESTAQSLLSCLKCSLHVNVLKLSSALSKSIEGNLGFKLDDLVEAQDLLYAAVEGTNTVEVHSLLTNTTTTKAIDKAIPFNSSSVAFLLPDSSVCIVGTTTNEGIVQRYFPATDTIQAYSPIISSTSCFGSCNGKLYCLSSKNNKVLDFKTTNWKLITKFELGTTPLCVSACGPKLWVVATRKSGRTAVLHYTPSRRWVETYLTLQVDHPIAIIAGQESCIVLQSDKTTIVAKTSAEERPFEINMSSIKSTVNLYKGNFYCFGTRSEQQPNASRMTRSLPKKLQTAVELMVIPKA
jgi:hypothetical protein